MQGERNPFHEGLGQCHPAMPCEGEPKHIYEDQPDYQRWRSRSHSNGPASLVGPDGIIGTN